MIKTGNWWAWRRQRWSEQNWELVGLKNKNFQPGTFELLAPINLNKGKKRVPTVFCEFWVGNTSFSTPHFFCPKSVRHQRPHNQEQHTTSSISHRTALTKGSKKTVNQTNLANKDSRNKLASHGYEEACSCCQSRNLDPNQAWRRQTSCHT